MSKAFVKDDADAPDEEAPLPARPAERLPITPRGFAALRAELERLNAAGRGAQRRARLLEQILGGVYVQPPRSGSDEVGFGSTVTVEADGARRRYTLVGPDEVDVEQGLVSASSPLGRSLLGRAVGDEVVVRRPKGDESITIVAIDPWVE